MIVLKGEQYKVESRPAVIEQLETYTAKYFTRVSMVKGGSLEAGSPTKVSPPKVHRALHLGTNTKSSARKAKKSYQKDKDKN